MLVKAMPEGTKNLNLTLLYRGSRDGWKHDDFHRKCDDHNNTLLLVKTKKGKRFGGFTT